MSADWDATPWSCAGPVGAKPAKAVPQEDQRGVPPYVPPPHRDPKRVAKQLKPEKWRAAFDFEGRPVGFHKLLKAISLGGVDHSIRAEVWEFLLGCYALGTTSEYRQELRALRRERYRRLIEQCQQMHTSIGTGTLAYTVGSKVMDVRIMSKDSARKEAKRVNLEPKNELDDDSEKTVMSALADDFSGSPQFDTSGDFDSSVQNVSAGFDTLYKYSSESPVNEEVLLEEVECKEELFTSPTRIFDADPDANGMDDTSASLNGYHLSGQMDSACSVDVDTGATGDIDNTREQAENKPKRLFATDGGPRSWSAGSMKRIKSRLVRDRKKKDRGTKIGVSTEGVREDVNITTSHKPPNDIADLGGDSTPYGDLHEPVVTLGKNASEERVAEWLWILHRIVVDVVRTDRHLEFYGDAKNMARMSDILAVYAWIDPKTGYCQGMSDLLSPFIVLFEDDADAFWCFESLLRRVRQNFQMEGPVGVMKQLEALSKILELTDPQISRHLTVVGADNFLFAFRMLLVLFRRELSFGESLFMWEMMWAADFNQAMAWAMEFNCLEALVLRLPLPGFMGPDDNSYIGPPASLSFSSQNGCSPMRDFSSDSMISNSSTFGGNFLGRSPFCGLRPGALLTKNRQRVPSVSTLIGRNGDEELSVFCVAAILVQNRNQLLKDIQSMDDAIKTFNDMNLNIRVHSSIHTAMKLRKKYRSRLSKHVFLERRHTMAYSS